MGAGKWERYSSDCGAKTLLLSGLESKTKRFDYQTDRIRL